MFIKLIEIDNDIEYLLNLDHVTCIGPGDSEMETRIYTDQAKGASYGLCYLDFDIPYNQVIEQVEEALGTNPG